jgi:MobA-like NTP transferase domain
VTSIERPLRAIVLAGGACRRLGVDKPEQRVGGRRLLDIALAAVANADTVVVVGPPRQVPDQVTVLREDPPGSGPVAALAAGLAALPDGPADIAVLAADLPRITPASTSSDDSDAGDHSSRRPAVRSAPVAFGPREITRALPKASSSGSARPQDPAAATQPRKPIPVVAIRMSDGLAITSSVAARRRASSASGTIWMAAAATTSAPRRRSIVANSSTRRDAVMATVKPPSDAASAVVIPSLSAVN